MRFSGSLPLLALSLAGPCVRGGGRGTSKYTSDCDAPAYTHMVGASYLLSCSHSLPFSLAAGVELISAAFRPAASSAAPRRNAISRCAFPAVRLGRTLERAREIATP
ncbi:hypothetical protein FB451DRAFT_1207655 [Mycena latifolia]|nr:hypothetical protein FB451DRAFT_1207655 [Mycena latifolia]